MKFNKKLKKGFTLVELIVVIAIVAILAAVSVVSYVSFIGAANTSADQQAVTQMNKILMLDSILNEDSNIYDLYEVLEQSGLSAKDYKPLVKDRYFFWDRKLNRIVYADKEYQVIYPAEYESATKANGWYSLSNEIVEKTYETETNYVPEGSSISYKKVEMNEGGQVAKIAKDLSEGNNNFKGGTVTGGIGGVVDEKVYIKFTEEKIDLMGGSFNFCAKNCDIVIEGADGTGTTLTGIVNAQNFEETNNAERTLTEYGAGLLGYIADCNVTIRNIKVENCYFGDEKNDLSGAGLVGFFTRLKTTGNPTLTFENVEVVNNYNVGHHGIGSLLGRIDSYCSVNFVGNNAARNCTNKSMEPGRPFAAGVIGEVLATHGVTISGLDHLVVENNTNTIHDGSKAADYFAIRYSENSVVKVKNINAADVGSFTSITVTGSNWVGNN